jgi:hypothetical protein
MMDVLVYISKTHLLKYHILIIPVRVIILQTLLKGQIHINTASLISFSCISSLTELIS